MVGLLSAPAVISTRSLVLILYNDSYFKYIREIVEDLNADLEVLKIGDIGKNTDYNIDYYSTR